MSHQQTCTRCIMDTSAAGITFDEHGVCNYCTGFLADKFKVLAIDPAERDRRLHSLVDAIKAQGKGKKYDCVIGISGGVDSSWVLVQAIRLGLRPLAVHMDNGWNSELAQNNIANLVRGLGVDLYTHVIDWPEIRGLMDALFSADVLDVELLYDNAMLAVNYRQAAKFGLHYILGGTNLSTEGVAMPINWNWHKHDKRNITSISKEFNGPRIKTFPAIGTLDLVRYIGWNKIKWVSFLNYVDYRKNEAVNNLVEEFKYKPYPYKHYESVFTRFYQGYILPNKFGIDKRKVHFSTLMMTNQMTREEALENCQGIAYASEKDLESDKKYFLKKMGWSEEKLAAYISRPEVPHDAYPSEAALFERMLGLYKRMNLKAGRVVWDAAP